MTSAALLLAAAALAAEPEPKPLLPDGSRWSGPVKCRDPKAAGLKRAVLLADKKEDGSRRAVLRGVDAEGVVVDERVFSLSDSGPVARRADPSVPRRGKPAKLSRALALMTSDEREPALAAKIEVSAKGGSLKLSTRSSDKTGATFGGDCSGTLALEPAK